VSDLDTRKLEDAAYRYRTIGFLDYREMLEETKPDLVTIATRAEERPSILAHVAKSVGLIYSEKPIAKSVSEANDVLEADALIAYGVNRRYHATYRHAKRMIEDGAIGRILDVTSEMGRGELFWTHSHSVDLFLMFLGTAVAGVSASLEDGEDPIVRHACFRFASGASATINQTGGCNLRIGGARGTLTIVGDGELIQLETGNGYFRHREEIRVDQPRGATVTALTELIAGRVSVPREEIRLGISMLEACKASNNRTVRL
jgi:predicted dehydrogenase